MKENELTPQRLKEIHDTYEAWAAYRKFDTSFETFVDELEMKAKAEAYDRLVTEGLDAEFDETTYSTRPTGDHWPFELGHSL